MPRSPIEVVTAGTAREFLARAGDWLYEREAEFGLMIGLAEGLMAFPPTQAPCLLCAMNGDMIEGALLQTRPENVIVTSLTSGALEALVEHLRASKAVVNGIVGPAASARAFAAAWSTLSGRTIGSKMEQRVYRLDRLIPAVNVRGGMRPAQPKDVDLAGQWLRAFAHESLAPHERMGEEQARTNAGLAIERGRAYFWEVDGKPVSMALSSRPTRNGMSIGPVYTPPRERARGYASGLVSTLSERILASGKRFCVLYTDASNPTSNGIYRRLGYTEVAESVHIAFA